MKPDFEKWSLPQILAYVYNAMAYADGQKDACEDTVAITRFGRLLRGIYSGMVINHYRVYAQMDQYVQYQNFNELLDTLRQIFGKVKLKPDICMDVYDDLHSIMLADNQIHKNEELLLSNLRALFLEKRVPARQNSYDFQD